MKEIRYRCWIEIGGEKIFGPGPLRLLELIEKNGSLSKAAKEMNMSYKKAWGLINKLNMSHEEPVITSQKGGTRGGGAAVTERGRELIRQYRTLSEKLEDCLSGHKEILELF
ncbi:winged helix-turn-helix domain-containing protein [Roseivirga sp. BDSF3-8]|uniref:winged helix-turn-helix domain-containing protein n=1 Tax=Roseivirga sp. BDSF3-8 TaxID=3241598 RepID=UPI0035320A31